ncbi:hypothetical protein ACFO3U_04395 [Flavobacterium ponti]|uniref:PKD domain-containing protein n=1 Tax=Flavobacterium ponti TaxID=665133 RepID=A0ABV9P4Q7_9FLAO
MILTLPLRLKIGFLFILIASCSPDNSQEKESFAIEVIPSAITIPVDKQIDITIASETDMNGIIFSYDNFATEFEYYSNYGTSKTINFYFDTVGSKTIYFKATKEGNISSEVKTVTINVVSDQAVKLTGLQLISFTNVNGSWDPEFPATNPNHLADVVFGLRKNTLNNPFSTGYSYKYWFSSTVKTNQGDLTWDLTNENLYFDPTKTLQIGFDDQDNLPASQPLITDSFGYRTIGLNNYMVTKPSEITFSYPEVDLEFKIQLEWPN